MSHREHDPDTDSVFEHIRECGVLPVVTLDHAEDALRVGEALLRGGLPCAEVTFRTDAGLAALAALADHLPELSVGAGTVLTVDQARRATEAGGRFVVSPGFDDDVVAWCRDHHIPTLPGVMTPTEVTRAVRSGLSWVKFFPAGAAGGPTTLEALSAPFPDVHFVPTGGIGPANLTAYLRVPAVAACGGSWLVGRSLVAGGDFAQIERLAAEAVAIVRRARDRS